MSSTVLPLLVSVSLLCLPIGLGGGECMKFGDSDCVLSSEHRITIDDEDDVFRASSSSGDPCSALLRMGEDERAAAVIVCGGGGGVGAASGEDT